MTGIAHSCPHRLPCSEELYADFYLPRYQLYIDYWGLAEDGKALTNKMKKKEVYQAMKLEAIDIEENNIAQLDEVLTRHLRQHGIRVY